MSSNIITLTDSTKTNQALPRTRLKAIADENGAYLNSGLTASDINQLQGKTVAEITQSITDGDTTHSPSGNAVHDAISGISKVSYGAYTIPTYGGVLSWSKVGRVCSISIEGLGSSSSISSGSGFDIDIDLPSDLRPLWAMCSTMYYSGSINFSSSFYCKLNSSGTLNGYAYGEITAGRVSFTYISAS